MRVWTIWSRWTLDGLGRNTVSLVFMQMQWPVFFQQLAEIPTNTRNERWEVFLWAVGNPHAIHVADMLMCPRPVTRAMGFLSTSSLVSSKPPQGLEQLPQLKKMPLLQGSTNGGTSKPNRLQQQTQLPNLQWLSACCVPIKRHLKKNLSELH